MHWDGVKSNHQLRSLWLPFIWFWGGGCCGSTLLYSVGFDQLRAMLLPLQIDKIVKHCEYEKSIVVRNLCTLLCCQAFDSAVTSGVKDCYEWYIEAADHFENANRITLINTFIRDQLVTAFSK